MGFAFNPFTGNFDLTGSGGGGASYIDGEVQNFSALSQTIGSPPEDSAYLVREAEGAWLLARKPAGIYIRTADTGVRAADWTHAGAFPDVFNDANFLLYDNGDSTRNLQFQLSGIDTATTRVLTAPNADGTIALTNQISKTYAVFTATDNQPPATAFATLDTRNSIAVLDFDDTTDESAVFVGIMPEGASLGSGLKIRLHWMSTNQTTGSCAWDVSLERMNTDLDSDDFGTIASAVTATSGTAAGIITVTEITLTTIDGVTAGDAFRLKVTRDANKTSSPADDLTNDAELVVVEVRSAA